MFAVTTFLLFGAIVVASINASPVQVDPRDLQFSDGGMLLF